MGSPKLPRTATERGYMVEAGRRIKAARLAIGLSQTKLANTIGVTFQQVQKYETGVNQPSYYKLVMLAGALNTTLPHLLGLDATGQPVDAHTLALQAIDAEPVGQRALSVLIEAHGRDDAGEKFGHLCKLLAAFETA